MPQPYIFASREVLVEALASPDLADKAHHFFAARCYTIDDVVKTGVGGNTFRAFRHVQSPSVAFRTWTTATLIRDLQEFVSCDANSYAILVHNLTLGLETFWRSHAHKEMGYGRGAKLLNLVLKKLGCYANLSEVQRSMLISHMHVPWDSYTIQGLKLVAPELRIPRGATMKFITTPEQYQAFVSVITGIAAEAGVPAIYYDVLAWDQVH